MLLPPSEGKTRPRRGRPLDLDRLSFPELTPARQTALDALTAVSATPQAVEHLKVGASLAAEVAANVDLKSAPTATAAQVYSGVLYSALDQPTLDTAARRRANRWLVTVSALYGAVRPTDRIAAYRLSMGVSLPGLGPVASLWRPVLDPVLTEAAGRGPIVDCRSSTYVAAWTPHGPAAHAWITVTVPGATHMAKHTRGLVARHLCEHGSTPRTPKAVAAALADGPFTVDLTEPARAGRPWTLSVTSR